MVGRTCCISKEIESYEQLKHLVERGRQMHNQAVFELFARLGSNVVLFSKKCCGITIRNRASRDHNGRQSIKQSARNPVQAVAGM